MCSVNFTRKKKQPEKNREEKKHLKSQNVQVLHCFYTPKGSGWGPIDPLLHFIVLVNEN